MVKVPGWIEGAGKLKKLACGFMAGAALLTALPLQALACTQVWVPGSYTANGDRYVGRSEDCDSRYLKIFGVEESRENTVYTSDETDFKWTSSKKSYRYTYVRDHPTDWHGNTNAYSEAGINEHGLSCSATLTTSMNEGIAAIDPLHDRDNPKGQTGGIGEYSYASIILGECKTAREAVELVGSIIDEHGAAGNDQITISDVNETWLLCVLSGTQWVAYKMPDDQLSVNPNMSNLRFSVDLDDTESCLHSEKLLTLPEGKGLLKRFEDGTPDIALTYGKNDDKQTYGSMTRYLQGRLYFDAPYDQDKYLVEEGTGVIELREPTQFFTSERSDWSTNEILRSLATRGEGTEVDANIGGMDNIHYDAIGNNRTVESHVFQVRQGLPADIATIQWEALSRAEFSVFVPLYSALITEASPYFADMDIDPSHQGALMEDGKYDHYDSVSHALMEEPDGSLSYVLMDINTLAYNSRFDLAEGTRKYLDALQAQIIAQHEQVDSVMQKLPEDERAELANRAQLAVVEQTYLKCDKLLDEMRAHYQEGSFETFYPSDYDADADDLVEPITYAASVIEPLITQQPSGATYDQGATASDLSVVAVDAGGFGDLTYEWFVQDGENAVSTGVKSSSLPIDTSKPGAFDYFCRVTNVNGLFVDSEVARITIKAAPKPVDPKPEPPSSESEQGGNRVESQNPGDLPQTGDPMAAIAIAGMAAAGFGIAAAGVRCRRGHGLK